MSDFPIFLQVFNQSYKIMSLDSVLIVKHNEKIQLSNENPGLIDAVLSDFREKKEQVSEISESNFHRLLQETIATIAQKC